MVVVVVVAVLAVAKTVGKSAEGEAETESGLAVDVATAKKKKDLFSIGPVEAKIEGGEDGGVKGNLVDVLAEAKTGGNSAVDIVTAKTGGVLSLIRPRRVKAFSIAISMACSKNVSKKASCLAEKQSFSAIFEKSRRWFLRYRKRTVGRAIC